ncbi:MAG: bifunctional glutamate N-acetyltransferase/amino-acid acetyltransferase ArgJ [Bacteroidota bacterium]
MKHPKLKTVFGGVCAPQGFIASGVRAGIKKSKKDVSLIYSEVPAHAAGVFTQSRTVAACVTLNRKQLQRSKIARAILINSGNANACTGERGMMNAKQSISTVASALSIKESQVLIASTGVIGQFLPMDKLTWGIYEAAKTLSKDGSDDAAEGICTTDTFPKECAVEFEINGVPVRIGGIAKGSGMIAPNMATMLAFITTDANISHSLLRRAFQQATEQSFNRITVDGDTSTNDMALILANGKAENREIKEGTNDYKLFYAALEHVMITLSKLIVKDGEGATKFVEVTVTGAKNVTDAEKACRTICNSPLVKTAIHGEDANWGRILAAVGYAGIDFNPDVTEIFFDDVKILGKKYDINFSEEKAKEVLQKKEITITVNLNGGKHSATFWTCDLSAEYVRINASYRS